MKDDQQPKQSRRWVHQALRDYRTLQAMDPEEVRRYSGERR